MLNTKTIFPVVVVVGILAIVGVIVALGAKVQNAMGMLAECRDAYATLELETEKARTKAVAEARKVEQLQVERTQLIDQLAAKDAEDREPLVKYITREVVRYVQVSGDRVVLPAEWVRIYNASGGSAVAPTEAALPAGLLDGGTPRVHSDAGGSDSGRRGAGHSDPEQPQPPADLSTAIADAGVGKELAQ